MASHRIFPTYESIGVRPLINCKGTITMVGGSIMLPTVIDAMNDAAKCYVNLEELMEAVGARIAELMQCEWGLVTTGCAAALCQITAACVAGTDPEKIALLPDTTGMKNEVLVQPTHHHGYEHAVRMVGVRMIEVRDLEELKSAINDRTAMLLLFGDASDRGTISVRDTAQVGRDHGVPTFVDAAAERPDVPNWYLSEGADAVAYSGGKCLRGPQSSGFVLGRKNLLQAAFMNGSPHQSIGRPMKASKEETMGLLAAIEQWFIRDHNMEWKLWESWLGIIAQSATIFDFVTASIRPPGRSNVAPVLSIEWSHEILGISGEEVSHRLSRGEPRIEVNSHEKGISIMPYMMEDGEAEIVAQRLAQILKEAERTET
ncbi:MAG: D-glucosaminate-6-phosphate ammonia lyase [Candidatus Moanabacter tarae]|uniref:D-glucosaminate-6-phosphate ammonia lyase n=1 Tax=Candidatus Moanibacter tarae TaxID=2200854 RepID=A0A2Z4AFL0_9BACT|nr:MAG: D-glucosaminate-6-phosphate ammonia lyase [Candidatus Moanabacter tarae]